MRDIVWVSPLPPQRTGVSAYSTELLPRLGERLSVSVLTPPKAIGEVTWEPPPSIRFVENIPRDALRVVHLGNNPYHEWVLPYLKGLRSVGVIHDLVLHHLLVEATLGRDDRAGYERLISRAEPGVGPILANGRRFGFGGGRDAFLFPAFAPFLERVGGAVTHSVWAARQVRERLPQLPVETVRMGVADPGPVDRVALRHQLGLEDEDICLMHLGFLTPAKGLEVLLSAVAAAVRLGVRIRFVLVGEGSEEGRVARTIQAVDLEHHVIGTGWVDEATMRLLPAAADLGVVVRRPSAGETSAAALRFLACGTPVAVSAIPQLLEIPEVAAPRLTPGSEAAELTRLLRHLAEEPAGTTEERRNAARSLFEAEHTLDHAAGDYLRALEELSECRQ